MPDPEQPNGFARRAPRYSKPVPPPRYIEWLDQPLQADAEPSGWGLFLVGGALGVLFALFLVVGLVLQTR